jgi:hypothetical protein
VKHKIVLAACAVIAMQAQMRDPEKGNAWARKAGSKDQSIAKPVPARALPGNVLQPTVLVSYGRARQPHTGNVAGAFREQAASRVDDAHARCSQDAQMAVVPQDHAGAIIQSRHG